jgi:uncharacterized protein YyaL (SSP411 family)
VLAVKNAEFLLREMVRDGRVMRSHTAGVTRIAGYLEDHAAVALAFLDVYGLTFDRRWLDAARTIADAVDRWFWDDNAGAYFDTASDAEVLLTRPRDVTDNAVPAGTSLAVDLLLRLAEIVGDDARRQRAMRVLESLTEPLARYAPAFGHLLGAADMAVHGAVEVALAGDPATDEFRALADAVGTHYVHRSSSLAVPRHGAMRTRRSRCSRTSPHETIRPRRTCAGSISARNRRAIPLRFQHSSSAHRAHPSAVGA